MAQYYTSFEHQPAGSQPSGWTELWNGSSSTWTVTDSGTKFVRNNISSTNDDRLLRWDTVGSPTDVEVVVRVRTSSNTGYQNTIYVRASTSGGPLKNGYYLTMNETAGAKRLLLEQWYEGTYYYWHHVDYSWTANTWYWMRYKVSGNTHQAKIWQDGSSEPASWNISRSDTSGTAYNGSGIVALAGYTASGNRDFDVVGVGTNGDSAPTEPLLETLVVDNASHSTTSTIPELSVPPTPVEATGAVVYGGWGAGISGGTYFGTGTALVSGEAILTAGDAYHYIQSPNITLVEHKTLAVDDASHNTESGSPSITEHKTLQVDSATHAVTSEELALSGAGVIAPAQSIISITSTEVTLTQAHMITVDDSAHSLTSDGLSVTENITAFAAHDASHTIDSTNIDLLQDYKLAVDDTLHTSGSNVIALDQQQILGVDDAVHTVVSDSFLMDVVATLIVDSPLHYISSTDDILIRRLIRDIPRDPKVIVNTPRTGSRAEKGAVYADMPKSNVNIRDDKPEARINRNDKPRVKL